jgi:hypothetical protein
MDSDFATVENLCLTSEQYKAVGFLAELTRRMVILAFPAHNKTPAGALNLVREVYAITDKMVTGCLKNGAKPFCEIGCYRCCYLRVRATPLELLGISDFLRSRLEPGQLAELRQRIAATEQKTRGMDSYQRICAEMICPLLANGKCLAYPVRPIECRIYHSLDLSDCQTPFVDRDRSVTIRNDVAGLGMGIFAGLTEGLQEVGLQTRILELVAGLYMVMDEPGVVERWLAGEPALAGAEIAHAENIKSVHQALVEELGEPWNMMVNSS